MYKQFGNSNLCAVATEFVLILGRSVLTHKSFTHWQKTRDSLKLVPWDCTYQWHLTYRQAAAVLSWKKMLENTETKNIWCQGTIPHSTLGLCQWGSAKTVRLQILPQVLQTGTWREDQLLVLKFASHFRAQNGSDLISGQNINSFINKIFYFYLSSLSTYMFFRMLFCICNTPSLVKASCSGWDI